MRRFVLPLVLLVVGVEIGILLDHFLLWRRPPPPPIRLAAVNPPEPAAHPEPGLEVSASGSFGNNFYTSLLLSFGTAYPEYLRCLTVSVAHAPVGATCQLRIESSLFLQPYTTTITVSDPNFEITPDLPWNLDLLRRVTQPRPEAFVVSATLGGRRTAQSSVTCTIHPVNEVVSRVFDPSSGGWQDTSVCFAAYVNENDPWINTFLQDLTARGRVQRFGGYELGAQGIAQQIQAIWDGLAARGLSYVNLATTSGGSRDVSTQYVRFVEQSVRDQGANCVDASVLLASIFRRIGLRPVLVFKPGHCLVAVYDAAQGGHLMAIETTVLNVSPLAAAVSLGTQELQTVAASLDMPGYSTVDIAAARQEGIMPIDAAEPRE